MLTVTGLCKAFRGSVVLRNIDLELRQGDVMGLIGRSGSGKSTLARCLVGLERADSGSVALGGRKIAPGQGDARRRIQYLWQDPVQALSPFLSARGTVLETLNGFRIGAARGRKQRAEQLLQDLGIGGALQTQRPHMLSGGQCQRVALARALAAEPDALILDEPFSSLDLATQVTTMELLETLLQDRALAVLIISHDLAPLLRLSHRIAVLEAGSLAEDLPTARFLDRASHPLSRAYAAQAGRALAAVAAPGVG